MTWRNPLHFFTRKPGGGERGASSRAAGASAAVHPGGDFAAAGKAHLARIRDGLDAWRGGRADADSLAALGAEFRALQRRAAASGHAEIAVLGGNLARLLAQSSPPRDAHDVGLLNLLEEAHDGLRAELGLSSAAARGHVKSLNSMVALLLPRERERAHAQSAAPGGFAGGLHALHDAANDAAKRAGKKIAFAINGGAFEVEQEVSARIRPALELLLSQRIENASARINIDLALQDGEALLEYADDGRGADMRAVAEAAVAFGMCAHAADVQAAHVLQILSHANRTANLHGVNLSAFAGMQKMHAAVTELGGLLTLQSDANGMRMQCLLPRAPANSRALFVTAGGYRIALPARQVECITRAPSAETICIGARTIPCFDLAAELGAPPSTRRALLVLRLTDRFAAFAVDAVHGVAQISRRAPGAQLASVRGLQCIAVQTGGGIAPMFDPAMLTARDALHAHGAVAFPLRAAAQRALALETPRGAALLPLNAVAEIVIVRAPPQPRAAEFAPHQLDWRGRQLPLLDAAAAIGAPPAAPQPGARAVVVWPMRDGRAGDFFALACAHNPRLIELPAHAEPAAESAPGSVQLDGHAGVILDLPQIARRIFAADARVAAQ